MTIPEMSKALMEFGIMIVICAIFLYTAVRLINVFMKSLDSRIITHKHDELADIRMSVNQQVQSLIDDYLESHDSDRVHVIEFTNSVMSVAYLPFKYMSCSYEVYRIGKSATANKIDHISTSLFPKFFEKLYDNDYVILDANNEDKQFGKAIYDVVRASGESLGLYAILRTSRGKALGYVCITKDEGFHDTDIQDVQILASKLSALLSVADK